MIYQSCICRVAFISVVLAFVAPGPFALAVGTPSSPQLPQESGSQSTGGQPPIPQAAQPPLQLIALSSDIFEPYLPTIQAALADDVSMRLPDEVRLVGEEAAGQVTSSVEVKPFADDLGVAVDVTTCGIGADCISGTFAVGRGSAPVVEEGLQIHQTGGYPITLAPGVEGYLLTKLPDGAPSPVMSVMWEQDQSVYRVQFPAQERQNILFMARSMVLSTPIMAPSQADTARAFIEESPPSRSFVSPSEDTEQADLDDTDLATIQRPNLNQERLIHTDSDLPQPLSNDDVLSEPDLPGSVEADEATFPEVDEQVNESEEKTFTVQSIMARRLESIGDGEVIFSNRGLVFSDRDLNETIAQALKDLDYVGNLGIGMRLTLEDLRKVANAVTLLYFSNGYITSRAIAAETLVDDTQVAWIGVIEGELSEIVIAPIRDRKSGPTNRNTDITHVCGGDRIEAPEEDVISADLPVEAGIQATFSPDIEHDDGLRISASYICRRLELGAGSPLQLDDLESQLRLLRENPLFEKVEADLSPARQGQSRLTVRIKEAQPLAIGLSVDNYSPPSVGSERVGVQASYLNLTGRGDELAANYYRTTTGGLSTGDITYRLPLNAMNGTLQLRGAFDRTQVTQRPFNVLDIRGETEQFEISFRQPFVRSAQEEFALSWGFRHREGRTILFDDLSTRFPDGPSLEGVSRTSVFTFGQDYRRRGSRGAWALSSQFNFGTGLFNATTNDEPIPDGHFFSWQGQAQRVQRLSKKHLLIMRSDIQLTPDSLLSSERFVMGGGQTLRGYRQNVRSGDSGFRFSIEDRIDLGLPLSDGDLSDGSPVKLNLVPFIDVGMVWNSGNNPNELLDSTILAGAGLGLLWEWFLGVENLSVRVDYAVPLVPIDDKGNNAQDEGIFFRVLYDPD